VYGIVTRNPSEVEWPEFDVAVYEAKGASGSASAPLSGATNAVSCFADAAAADEPGLVAVAADGARATADAGVGGYVCPTHPGYREGLRETIADCVAASPDLRLDDAGFPGGRYCHCDRCDERFAASDFGDRDDWRAATVRDFLDGVRDAVPGTLSLAVHPDPYPGHLRERSGIDLDTIGPLVDSLVVPLYDRHYDTTYWIETIASGFADAVPESVAIDVELFGGGADVGPLLEAVDAAAPHADAVLFGYDAATARAALRRLRADASGDGE
jgi:hypothetical protein